MKWHCTGMGRYLITRDEKIYSKDRAKKPLGRGKGSGKTAQRAERETLILLWKEPEEGGVSPQRAITTIKK